MYGSSRLIPAGLKQPRKRLTWPDTRSDVVGLSELKLKTPLVAYLRRCATAAERGEALPAQPTQPSVYTAPKRHLRDRLTADEVEQLLADYRAGILRRDLAEQYGISISSLARIVRRHDTYRRRRRDSTA